MYQMKKKNTESNNDGKRKLASDNYIILRFNTSVTYNNSLLEYKLQRSISKIDNNGQIITNLREEFTFTVSPNTDLKIYFREALWDLSYLFDAHVN